MRLAQGNARFGLLAVPPPFRAWLAFLSDPDHTTAANWAELADLFYHQARLPYAENAFLRNRNPLMPDQVAVETHPPLAQAPIEAIHTWGDYMQAEVAFNRQEAEACANLARQHGLQPRIWVDHSFFVGNLFHNAPVPPAPEHVDQSGHRYPNPYYTFDLAYNLGVRYVWNGHLADTLLAQDVPLSRATWYTRRSGSRTKGQLMAALDGVGRPLWRWTDARRFSYAAHHQRVLHPHTMPDGRRIYTFYRTGQWALADVDGLEQQLAPNQLHDLLQRQGVALLYTHLGKRRGDQLNRPRHLTPPVLARLDQLAQLHHQGQLNLSTPQQLLDYLVLRDHALLDAPNRRLVFRSDGIRYQPLTRADLAGHRFGLMGRLDGLTLWLDDQPLTDARLTPDTNRRVTLLEL